MLRHFGQARRGRKRRQHLRLRERERSHLTDEGRHAERRQRSEGILRQRELCVEVEDLERVEDDLVGKRRLARSHALRQSRATLRELGLDEEEGGLGEVVDERGECFEHGRRLMSDDVYASLHAPRPTVGGAEVVEEGQNGEVEVELPLAARARRREGLVAVVAANEEQRELGGLCHPLRVEKRVVAEEEEELAPGGGEIRLRTRCES